jgi:hypothetical protein
MGHQISANASSAEEEIRRDIIFQTTISLIQTSLNICPLKSS